MTQQWNNIKWIFEPDGELRDIYVQDVTLTDWSKLIDFLNLNCELRFGEDKTQIDKEYVLRFLADETGEMESCTLNVSLENLNLRCYFFLPDMIEFDIDPTEVKSIDDFNKIVQFITDISKVLNKQITLTMERTPELPLIKIDFNKNICIVLTSDEEKKLLTKSNSFSNRISSITTRLMMIFQPKLFRKRLLKSANNTYAAKRKDENVW
jgi:hypothetical protein